MKKMICITCPTGCEMEVLCTEGKITVTGNRCPRGAAYAESEIRDPRRTVTAVVRCTDGRFQSVRTDKPLPRPLIPGLLNKILKATFPEAEPGAVIISDIEGTGVDLIATGPAR
jgi:CxxC motif-containing protein